MKTVNIVHVGKCSAPIESVAYKGCYENLAARFVCLQLCVAKYLVQTPGRVHQQREPRDPQPQRDVEDGLESQDLRDDHPGVPDSVPELITHHLI